MQDKLTETVSKATVVVEVTVLVDPATGCKLRLARALSYYEIRLYGLAYRCGRYSDRRGDCLRDPNALIEKVISRQEQLPLIIRISRSSPVLSRC